MALNFSHRPIFSGRLPEDNLIDPARISNGGYLVEGIPENNADVFGKSWHLNREVEDYGGERCDRGSSQESVSKDILDLLPSDPFGMAISSTFTAITGWLEDLEAGYGGYGSNEVGVGSGDYQLFAGLNFIWNNAMRFQAFQGNMSFNYQPNATSWHGGYAAKKGVGNVSCPTGFGSACNMEDIACGYSSEKAAGDVSCPTTVFGSACNMEGVNSAYSCTEKGFEDVSCPIAFGSARNMEGITSIYPLEEKGVVDVSCPIGFRSANNMEGATSGYSLEEKGVVDVSCPISFGSACNMEGVTNGYCLEKEITYVSCPLGHGVACSMEEISSGFGGCSEEMEVRDSSCAVGFGPTSNIEEIINGYGVYSEEEGVCDIPFPIVLASACNMENISTGCSEEKEIFMEDILSHGNDGTGIVRYQTKEWQEGSPESCSGNVVEACLGEAPRLVLGLAACYLSVRDLLAVESVCKHLRATVRSEPYLWTRINIDQPLNEKITDELLLQLTDRAQGELQSLSLVDCTRITDDALKHVLENNPKLTKLSVPGCSKLTIEGIVNNLKAFKSTGAAGIKHLKIGALYGVEKHFEELQLLLGIDSNMQKNVHNPRFYHTRHLYLSCDYDDDRALDIEICDKCERLRLIYDCTAEGCQGKERTPQVCRACTLCIARCFKCGRCIVDGEYEETFCLDWLCSFCKRQEDLAKSGSPSAPLQP